MIDTHAHLYAEEFDIDREELLANFQTENIKCAILPNEDASTIDAVLTLAAKHEALLKPTIGLHPTSVKEDFLEELARLEGYFSKHKFTAIGEIGLDFYWDRSFETEQIIAFETQIKWAMERDLPVIIHCRKAYNEIMRVLKRTQNGKLRGVFHCFSGNEKQAKEVIDLGFYLGIGGVVTYKNSEMAKVAASAPLEFILTETDAPFLSPTPMRGKRNEPKNIRFVIEKIAELRSATYQEIETATENNARKLFDLQ